MRSQIISSLAILVILSCSKKKESPAPVVPPAPISIAEVNLNNTGFTETIYGTSTRPVITVRFSGPVMKSTAAAAITLTHSGGNQPPIQLNYPFDSVITVQPSTPLPFLTGYTFQVTTGLKSSSGGNLLAGFSRDFYTQLDSSRKFPVISDDSLLTLVQKQTFRYFWDFGHPVSGLARERNASNETVTSGGSGFGIMTIPVAVNRNFITRAQALARMEKIVGFLKNTAVKVKGAFSHWLNGSTGAIIPFSANDNGADLVETSYLIMGLLTARQFFDGADAAETALRNDINAIVNAVEWNWFRQGGQDVLYWHYSPDKEWVMNLPVRGWNEALITYVMAASSTTHGIPASVYQNGWKTGSNFTNGNFYYGISLPLGPSQGGPLFFEHYSFLGINPTGLMEGGVDYFTQAKNHTLINYTYCRNNPKSWYGYSDSCWGLTASDIEGGYTASSPTNDQGFIAPTAALSSIPYTPAQSMAALKFFYYALGDKIWKEYGFVDAFSLQKIWFANSFLAIDQGPIILMIENYRTGLLWNLFTSCPEVKEGMKKLGFSAPYL